MQRPPNPHQPEDNPACRINKKRNRSPSAIALHALLYGKEKAPGNALPDAPTFFT